MVWKDKNVEEDEEQISRINSAGLTNITLENLWRDCYSAMAKGDLVLWNRKLDAIWVLLGGDCKEDGVEDQAIRKMDTKIYEQGSLNNKRTGFSQGNINPPIAIATQYIWLKRKSLFLKRLQNKQGKGTAYASNDEDDIE